MLKRLGFVGVAAVPVLALGLAAHVASVGATAPSYVVDSSADAAPTEGDCSGSNTCTLRDAVTLSDIAGGTNTITFAPSVTQPIDLSDGPLVVTGQVLTITGNGPAVTIIDGSGVTEAGVFDVFFSDCNGPCTHSSKHTEVSAATSTASPATNVSNGTLTLTGTTIRNSTHAAEGGAIMVESQATLVAGDDVFSGNTATGGGGAIFNDGTSTITGSTFTGNSAVQGGAVDNDSGTTTIGTSTFTSNGAVAGDSTAGGAVYSQFAALNVTQSVFSLNHAAGSGGALFDTFNSGTADISNDTFTGNKADDGNGNGDGGALAFVGETGVFVNNTVTGNTAAGGAGGIFVGADDDGAATVTFSDSLIAANSAPNCDLSGAGTLTADHDIDSGTSCMLPASPASLGNISNATGINLDSQLRANGGPTQTIALLPGSIAIDAGGNATCKNQDQRTVTRPQHGTCDIGAFEADPTTTTVTAGQQTVGGDVTLTATVTGNTGNAGTPQGTVAFTKNGSSVGSAPTDSSGVATLTLTQTIASDPLFAATFTPSNGFFGSTGSVTYTPSVAAVAPASVPVPATGAGGSPVAGTLVLLAGVALVAGTRRRR